jgi:hypothetical protein
LNRDGYIRSLTTGMKGGDGESGDIGTHNARVTYAPADG